MNRHKTVPTVVVIVAAIVAACSVKPAADRPAANVTASMMADPSVEPTRTPVPPTMVPTPRETPSPRPTPNAGTPTPSRSPYDAPMEAMIPRSLRGIELTGLSSPMAPFAVGGDMCLFLCPDEPGRLAKASGVPIDRMALAFGIPPDDSGFAAGVMAIRFHGVDDRSLVDVRLKTGSHSTPTVGLPAKVVKVRVGTRDVVWATWSPFFEDRQGEYLVEHDDVLFVVQGLAPSATGTVPDDVALLIEALP